jgi:signal peptidase I
MAPGQGISWVRVILGGALALTIATVLLALVGPLIAIRLYGGSHYQIASDAMAPTLLTGDWVLAEPLEQGAVPPRGAIVTYEHPQRPDVIMVMRVIGLPGETVQMRGGALYLGGQRAGMEHLDDHVIAKRPPARREPWPLCVNEPVEIDGACHQELWRETLPDGTATLILNTRGKIGLANLGDGRGGDDTPLFRVPGNAVFVMGDSRDNSADSRDPDHGMVPLRNLRHRVRMIHSSLDKSSRFFHPRWDRFFRIVR